MAKGERVSFPCGNLILEGIAHWPDSAPAAGVVVCHPHPFYGGDMDNNVVLALCRALATRGLAALRFNFRGVGRSQGLSGQEKGEEEDTKAALEFLSGKARRLGLAGYSFGASVAWAIADSSSIEALAFISPPPYGMGVSQAKGKPKMIVSGVDDGLIPALQIEAWGRDIGATVSLISGADHFWWGKEEELCQQVSDFFVHCLL